MLKASHLELLNHQLCPVFKLVFEITGPKCTFVASNVDLFFGLSGNRMSDLTHNSAAGSGDVVDAWELQG